MVSVYCYSKFYATSLTWRQVSPFTFILYACNIWDAMLKFRSIFVLEKTIDWECISSPINAIKILDNKNRSYCRSFFNNTPLPYRAVTSIATKSWPFSHLLKVHKPPRRAHHPYLWSAATIHSIEPCSGLCPHSVPKYYVRFYYTWLPLAQPPLVSLSWFPFFFFFGWDISNSLAEDCVSPIFYIINPQKYITSWVLLLSNYMSHSLLPIWCVSFT